MWIALMLNLMKTSLLWKAIKSKTQRYSIPGESEFSQKHRLPQDELKEEQSSENYDVLFELILNQRTT